jgi:hypothetical protein
MPTVMWIVWDGMTGFNCAYAWLGIYGNRRNVRDVQEEAGNV